MAGTKYESKIGQIPCNDQVIFAVLSNLENLKRFEEAIPKDKIKDLEITAWHKNSLYGLLKKRNSKPLSLVLTIFLWK